jgi:hypothetical protein
LAEVSAQRLHGHLRRGRSGKLKDAAIYWVSGGDIVDDKTQDDAAAFGLELPKQKKKESSDFEVWEENWETVQMFLRAQTQWNVSMDGLVGLKYEVLLGSGGLFDLYNVENRTDVLERLQVMEATALTELRKRSNGKSA